MAADIEARLAPLATLSPADLRNEWRRLTKSPLPRVSPKLLRLAIAWELQARAFGGFSRETIRKLDQVAGARTSTSPVQPGMRLVREWNGVAHVVTVGEDGVILWNGRDWGSLSEVAREITGTRWSGPAFFGLKKKLAA